MASAEANPMQASSGAPPLWPQPLGSSTPDFSLPLLSLHHMLPIGWQVANYS